MKEKNHCTDGDWKDSAENEMGDAYATINFLSNQQYFHTLIYAVNMGCERKKRDDTSVGG